MTEPEVAFYRLSRKIVNNQDAIPADAQQVIYYSLAIGHHVGVMDCLSELIAVPAEAYGRCISMLPAGEARRKLEGVLEWNEIEINRGHVDDLLPAFNWLSAQVSVPDRRWVGMLIQCLHEMLAEPAFYLMLKLRA